jgi:chromosome segregation ATPase
MAELDRRVSSLEEQMAHVVATLGVLATNQNHLDEALVTLTEAQIRTQEQFRDTDTRISNLASAIGQLIATKANGALDRLGELCGSA